MVVWVVVWWQEDGIISLSASEVAHLTELDVFGAEDAVLWLLDRDLCLVELSLRESTPFEGSELEFVDRVEEVLGVELLVRFQEGVQIPADDDLVLRQVFLQTQEITLQIFDLRFVLFLIWAEMHTGKDVVIGASKGNTLSPTETLFLLLVDFLWDLRGVLEFGEGILVEQHKGVLFGICDHILMRFFELVEQKSWVLLDEEDIGLQLVETLQKLLEFCLLIKEA